ncbi:MAG: hypothetical protein FWG64_06615 [Firmicutes bacterium]|nr:hypothetical protein [Bacillota bacterium]
MKRYLFVVALLVGVTLGFATWIFSPLKNAVKVADSSYNVIVRLYFYALFALFLATGGLSMFVLFPLYKVAFAPKAAYSELPIFALWMHIFKVMWRSATNQQYRDMYPSKITDPPKLNTDRNLVKIKPTWQGDSSNCDACTFTCCEKLQCPLFGKNGRCLSYDSLFFKYFYCGRYPENQAQIDYYDCPKWALK